MKAEALLRRYLEQRREMGETELVLDGLSVEEVMRLLGITKGSRGRHAAERAMPIVPETEGGHTVGEPASAGWREALRANGVAPASPAPETLVPLAPLAPLVPLVPGLVVGSPDGQRVPGDIGAAQTLEQLSTLIAACTRCVLYKTATHPVPGEGNAHAGLLCVGEAPGAQEDATGRPFYGQAGQLLTKILQAVNLSREEVFILNVLKHRPPGNRNPLPDEVGACRPYFVRQIELVSPKVILALGTFAAQSLLETKLSIGKLRGSVHRYHGIPVIVTYHPAALLRNPGWKRPTWEDVQLARRILDDASA
ncbi:MAG: uracil-DNA glycosylase [Gemmatimonadaceae bacterium]